MTYSSTPDAMPVLSRGKHRNARKGACFMELASYLAGEAWSDHPRCTHPLLAVLARAVNDQVEDEARSRIAPLIPEVIGLTGEDPRVDAWIARKAALAALPIAPFDRQKVAAVGVIRCERRLNELDGRPTRSISPATAEALSAVPQAAEWARSFSELGFGNPRCFSRRSAPTIVQCAVRGIAEACVSDPDAVLVDLLRDTIADCRDWFATVPRTVGATQWQEACRLTVS